MILKQERAFKNAYKKLHNHQKFVVDGAIKIVAADPLVGEQKKQDLANVHVYKFNIGNQLFLLAYTFDPLTPTLLLLGVHENFHKNLKTRI